MLLKKRYVCFLTFSICSVIFGLHGQPLRSVPVVKPAIVRTIEHGPAAFTQGLICVDSLLYESTGIVGHSTLRRIDALNGNVLLKIPVPNVFAEGITILNGELVQLTWQDQFAIRYDYPSLRSNGIYKYKGEGWGLTNDGANFIMSNGSDTLFFRNGKFEITSSLAVTLNGKPLKHLNELEYVNGRVYANVWYKDFIVEISLTDGRVTKTVDCSELKNIERPLSKDHVLNGIAYCKQKDEWYITGKNWKNMFIVRIP
ncbi:MAG: glutaminyl-peptide cyclotransferase [Chitinispirillales bacterium]|nr:glutaminyl-peptide cyclotransferase [Chitinispirillales bacterium]